MVQYGLRIMEATSSAASTLPHSSGSCFRSDTVPPHSRTVQLVCRTLSPSTPVGRYGSLSISREELPDTTHPMERWSSTPFQPLLRRTSGGCLLGQET